MIRRIPMDLRHAWGSIRRMPLVSSVIVLSLALGIGVNTVVFSWIQARVLNPVPGAERGASLLLIEPQTDAGLYPGASWPEFQDLQARLTSFESLIAARMTPLYVGPPGGVQRAYGLLVSDNYFRALGVRPAIGRFLLPEEVTHAGGAPVAVISHRLWESQFGGSADVLQRTVRINARELTVIGVTPEEFQGTTVGLQFDAWLPATLAPVVANGSREIEDRGVRGYGLIGRLRPGATRRQAQGELDRVMSELAAAYPATNEELSAAVLAFHQSPRGPQRMLNAALAILQGIMLVLLLTVCGNVANLLLARASTRQREMGIRLGLGARPRAIAGLMLTESALLGVAGALLGAALAAWATPRLLVLPLTGLPLRFQASLDGMGLAFAVALGLAAALLLGAAPAAHLARVEPQVAFRAGLASAGRNRLRHVLMGVQVALAMIVLLVAGLFFRSFMDTRGIDTGFRRDGALLVAYDLAGRRADAAFSRDLAARAIDTLQRLPSVEAAAIATSVPLDIHGLPSRAFTVEGHTPARGESDEALANTVSPGYFDVMGISLVEGGGFAPLRDTQAPRQVVVNQAFVERYVESGAPLGRQLLSRGGPYVIAGVVRNSLSNAFGEAPTPVVYFSYRDNPQPRGEMHVRFRQGAAADAGEVLRSLRDLDPDLPVFNPRSLAQHVDTNLVFRKVPVQMFAVLGPLLLLLAALGVYAVVSYAVSLRTREIGVRMALGATPGTLARQFVADSLGVAALGGLAGWSVALALASRFAPGGADAAVFAVVPLGLMTVAAIAAWVPARRAAAVNPAAALRAE